MSKRLRQSTCDRMKSQREQPVVVAAAEAAELCSLPVELSMQILMDCLMQESINQMGPDFVRRLPQLRLVSHGWSTLICTGIVSYTPMINDKRRWSPLWLRCCADALITLELDDHNAGDRTLAGLHTKTRLTTLTLRQGTSVTHTSVSRLTQLTTLRIVRCNAALPSLKHMTALTRLYLSEPTTTGLSSLHLPAHVTAFSLYDVTSDRIPSLQRWTHLTSLNVRGNPSIVTEADLMRLTNLTKLKGCDKAVTGRAVRALPLLKTLQLRFSDCPTVTDDVLSTLTGLTELYLPGNRYITDVGLRSLTCLRKLCLKYNENITDDALSTLHNLRSLSLEQNDHITDASLRVLTGLTKLDLNENARITDDALSCLTGLTWLCLYRNKNTITDHSLSRLTALTHLTILGNKHITEAALFCLTRLTYIDISIDNIKYCDPRLPKHLPLLRKMTYLDVVRFGSY